MLLLWFTIYMSLYVFACLSWCIFLFSIAVWSVLFLFFIFIYLFIYLFIFFIFFFFWWGAGGGVCEGGGGGGTVFFGFLLVVFRLLCRYAECVLLSHWCLGTEGVRLLYRLLIIAFLSTCTSEVTSARQNHILPYKTNIYYLFISNLHIYLDLSLEMQLY